MAYFRGRYDGGRIVGEVAFARYLTKYGILPEAIYAMEHLSLENYMDFRKRFLVGTKEELDRFNQTAPIRAVEYSEREFKALQQYDKKPKGKIQFDTIWSSEKDVVISQKSIIATHAGAIRSIQNAGHFPFSHWRQWEETIR